LSGMDMNKQPGGIHGDVRRNSLSPSEGESWGEISPKDISAL